MSKVKLAEHLKSSPMKWGLDGVDHINIHLEGSTSLGRELSNGYKCSFEHPILGHFASMESLWTYLGSKEKDDRLRYLHGRPLRALARKLKKVRIDNFRAIAFDSFRLRIESDPKLLKEFTESSLPLESYYTNDAGVRIRPFYSMWLVRGLEQMRLCYKEGVEFNIEYYKDNKEKELYEGLWDNL